MLTSLHIKNFKAWEDTKPIRLAPLTVIFGANSAGKSSLGHLLLALKQTILSTDRKRPLHLGDENALIDLGTFAECLHDHDLKNVLEFELGWKIPGKKLEVRDPISQQRFAGDEMQLAVTLSADAKEQPRVDTLSYRLLHKNENNLAVHYRRNDRNQPDISSSEYRFVRNTGRGWPLDEPDKFYRISDRSRARFKNAEFLSDFALSTEAALNGVYYLGPLRDHPKRIYSWSGETPESVGQKGELAVASILAASAQKRRINRGHRKHLARFDEFMAQWLKDMGIIESFSIKPVTEGRKEYEVVVKIHATASEVKITDVGFGVSQVLPALVQAFYCPPNSTVWMEQPEIHLHPQVQAELADVFISATQACENGKERHAQLIVESHSEHFLNRLQRRVAEGTVKPEDLAVYFCRRTGRRTGAAIELEPLRINEFGEMENWPENFFGDEMADIAGRTLAAMQRKREINRQGGSK
ncbi:DUF3696 domain-containing protein [Verminephrobacter eiseniae]|uniref:DUF3696 domain-containing protein n=1 Tax=Verminephrobacter eiseniae TaxID=364317 RepID=UPI00223733ED|nr:DUF3696 domain-containing protein [Verminephrobacter eiseniae]MCW5260130.1 DUF3696 domain-containing protein [Verminephrobacter eiseniae]